MSKQSPDPQEYPREIVDALSKVVVDMTKAGYARPDFAVAFSDVTVWLGVSMAGSPVVDALILRMRTELLSIEDGEQGEALQQMALGEDAKRWRFF